MYVREGVGRDKSESSSIVLKIREFKKLKKTQHLEFFKRKRGCRGANSICLDETKYDIFFYGISYMGEKKRIYGM